MLKVLGGLDPPIPQNKFKTGEMFKTCQKC